MGACEVCGNTAFHDDHAEEISHIHRDYVMIEHVPALICDRRGEASFSRETVERVRLAVREGRGIGRCVTMDILAYS